MTTARSALLVVSSLVASACLEDRHGTVAPDTGATSPTDTGATSPTDTGATSPTDTGATAPDGLVSDTTTTGDDEALVDTSVPPEACLTLVGDRVDFGRQVAGTVVELEVQVVNCGAVVLSPVAELALGSDPQFSIVTPPGAIAPGQSTTVVVRFAPRPELANVGCKVPDLVAAEGELVVTAPGASARAGVRGIGEATHEAGCNLHLEVVSPSPSVAGDPIAMRVTSNTNLCTDEFRWSFDGIERGGNGIHSDLSSTGLQTAEFATTEAGIYYFSVFAVTPGPETWTSCPSDSVVHEVDPRDGFVARLTWTHAGVTVPDPTVDARLELHIARVDPFGPGSPPPWSSNVWDTWPGWPSQAFDSAEIDAWPHAALSAVATAEFVPPGHRYAIGVKSATWSPGPGEAQPAPATATLSITVRGEVAFTRSFVIAPGELEQIVQIAWDPPGDALYTLDP